ncbi:SPOR domain-containing protein [Rhodocaloribacter sp.]
MSASLIEQLAARLGISTEEAERSLQTLITHLHEEIRAKGEASIPGLGVFRRDRTSLTFEAAPALEIAANYRFAGMPALPVSPEPEEPAPEVEELIEETEEEEAVPEEADVRSEEEVAEAEESVAEELPLPIEEEEEEEEETVAGEAAGAEEAGEETEEPVEAEAPDLFEAEAFEESFESEEEVWEAPRDDADHPLGPLPEPDFEEADYDVVEEEVEEVEIEAEAVEMSDFEEEEAAAEAEVEDEESIFNVIHFEDDEEVKEIVEPAGETAGEASEPETEEEDVFASEEEIETIKKAAMQPPPAPLRTAVRRDRDSRAGLFIVIGVLAVLAGAFFAYQVLKPGSEEPETPALTEDMTPADTSAAAALPSADSARTEAPAQPEQPVRRTLGGIDRKAGGWTVIVASETSREAAEAAAQPYLDLDLPVDVLRGVSKGVTRYRVGVGQFAGQAEAEAAIRRLSDRLPPGAWPLRITPRM